MTDKERLVSKIHAHLDRAVGLRLDPRHYRDCVGVVGPWRLRMVRAVDDDPSMEHLVAPNDYFSLCFHHLSSLNRDCVDTALTRARQARLPSPWTGRGIWSRFSLDIRAAMPHARTVVVYETTFS